MKQVEKKEMGTEYEELIHKISTTVQKRSWIERVQEERQNTDTYPFLRNAVTSSTVMPKTKMLSGPISSLISTFAPSSVPIVRAPLAWVNHTSENKTKTMTLLTASMAQQAIHSSSIRTRTKLHNTPLKTHCATAESTQIKQIEHKGHGCPADWEAQDEGTDAKKKTATRSSRASRDNTCWSLS